MRKTLIGVVLAVVALAGFMAFTREGDTPTDAASVSSSAATASGLDTASQKDCVPSLVASHIRAASGRPTKAIRKVVTKPRDRAVLALSLETRALGGLLTATSVSRCSRRRSSGTST